MSDSTESKRILPLRKTADGWFVLRIHHSAVPSYDYEAACKGLSEEGRQQELEINWNASTGKRVYPEFNYNTHVATEPIKWDGSTLYCGWDFGGCPAFVPSFINSYGQWCLLKPLAPLEDLAIGTYEFGEMVADYLCTEFAYPRAKALNDLPLKHFGDPAGKGPPVRVGDAPKEMRSHFDILKRGLELPAGRDANGQMRFIKKPGWGWRIQPGAVDNVQRQTAVKARLNTLIGGIPAMVFDSSATVLIEGFGGNYNYPQRADGRYSLDPCKTWWSHACNAVEYIATRLFSTPTEEEEEEMTMPAHVVRSRAAGREW